MVTNETKNGRKFIKMYDPETGEYLGPLVNMTHEEAHGKKPGISLSTSMMVILQLRLIRKARIRLPKFLALSLKSV